MELVISTITKIFNKSQIDKGTLVYGRHKSWPQGKSGFVTSVSDDTIVVQFHPGIGNVTNHFCINVSEAAAGDWEIRLSKDLISVYEFLSEGGEET